MKFYFASWKFLCICCFLSSNAFAYSSQNNNTWFAESGSRSLITVSLGPDFIKQGRPQTISLYPPFENYYTNKKSSIAVIDGGIFVGVERSITDKTHIQFGVGGYISEIINLKGDVWLFGSPLFDTLAYQYNVRNNRIIAEGKILFDTRYSQSLHPYFSGNIGAAFNQARDYQETPLIAGAVPTQPFSRNTQASFTWGVGVGVDASISKHVRLGIGYQFADLGSVSLGPTPAAITLQTLSFPHLYANQLRFQLSILK